MMLRLRADDLAWKQIDDEIVALDGRSATYLALNGSGARLWAALASGATHAELVSILVRAYAVDETQAAADTDAFLVELTAKGLLAA